MHLPDTYNGQKSLPSLVIGVGDCGCAVINKMIAAEYGGVAYIAVDSDSDSLKACKAEQKVCTGATEIESELWEQLAAIPCADMVFIVSGMGGATGTKIGPIIAEYAKQHGVLAIGIATMPMASEGEARKAVAEKGLSTFSQSANSVIVVPLTRPFSGLLPTATVENIHNEADKAIISGIMSLADTTTRHGLVGVDIADLKAVIKDGGICLMGYGSATGHNRAREAAVQTLQSSFLPPERLRDANGVILTIEGDSNMSMDEFSESVEIIQQSVGDNTGIILQAHDSGDSGLLSVVLIACRWVRGVPLSGSESC